MLSLWLTPCFSLCMSTLFTATPHFSLFNSVAFELGSPWWKGSGRISQKCCFSSTASISLTDWTHCLSSLGSAAQRMFMSSLSKSPPLETLKDESEIKYFPPFQPLICHSVLKDIDYHLGWRKEQERGEQLAASLIFLWQAAAFTKQSLRGASLRPHSVLTAGGNVSRPSGLLHP